MPKEDSHSPHKQRMKGDIKKNDMGLERGESRPPSKYLMDKENPLLDDLVKTRQRYAHHPHLEPWRIADAELNFAETDRGDKGFLNSRETRKFLLNFGVPWGKTLDAVTQGKFADFPTCIDRLETLQTSKDVQENTWRLLVHTDMQEAKMEGRERATGFISYDLVYKRMTDHGMAEDELFLFLQPYRRDDGKVEYAKMYRDLFPVNAEAKI
jgi:hypothetical protein